MAGFGTGPVTVAVLSGQLTSPSFTLPRGDRPFSLECPSNGVACGVNIAFSSTSGGPSFFTLQRLDGSGLAHAVHSGGGGCWYRADAALVLGRIVLTAPPSDVMSYRLTEIANR